MSEQMLESNRIVQQQVTDGANLIDTDEIIDVSGFDFRDIDEWLYIPECTKGSTVYNLHTWLKSQPEPAVPSIETANRKCVDTRTFVRPKKKSSRASFEVLFEAMQPLKSSNATDSEYAVTNKQESIPAMLKTLPPHSIVDNFLLEGCGAKSGHESMEVFLNMSHSKGIDSFINLTEPGFSDPIMNISQPSIFYSSISSLPTDDSLINSDNGDGENLGNLTRTINLSSYDLQKTMDLNNINDTFSRAANSTALSTESYENKGNETFTNQKSLDECKLNETYNAEMTLKAVTSQENVNVDLGSTYVNEPNDTPKLVQSNDKETRDLNSTYMSSNADRDNLGSLNRTYIPTGSETQDKDCIKIPKISMPQETPIPECINSNITHCQSPTVTSLFAVPNDGSANSTFKVPFPMSPPAIQKMSAELNSTFNLNANHSDQVENSSNNGCQDIKGPTSLREELLQEIKRSEENRIDSMQKYMGNKLGTNYGGIQTYRTTSLENVQLDIPMDSTFDAKKPELTVSHSKIQSKPQNGSASEKSSPQRTASDRKYYTFTKKSIAQHEILNVQHPQSMGDGDATFTKLYGKGKNTKSSMPRVFSKLPQFLQKSNPNLVSGSSKSIGLSVRTGDCNTTFMKGSQPNIAKGVEKSLNNKECNLGKMRSGSEQRLLELHADATDFPRMDPAGSTDSVNSTQSAHSAPDLDDRLSVCSDSCPNSYATQPLERLHQIARIQEESLGRESTPKGCRRVLDNTWSELTNVPSPIHSSSPLISPSESSQSINTDSQPSDAPLKQCNDATIVKKSENMTKATVRSDNKSKMRLPTNFYSGARAPSAVSAIPRPQSRIPALRFTRPILKHTQSEGKEG